MYTVVFKCKLNVGSPEVEHLVFDAYKESSSGIQQVIGNVYCFKNSKGRYQARSSLSIESCDTEEATYELETKALDICQNIIDPDRSHRYYWRCYSVEETVEGIIEKIEKGSNYKYIKFANSWNKLEYILMDDTELAVFEQLQEGDKIRVVYHEESRDAIRITKLEKLNE